jgi:hypothetical protein
MARILLLMLAILLAGPHDPGDAWRIRVQTNNGADYRELLRDGCDHSRPDGVCGYDLPTIAARVTPDIEYVRTWDYRIDWSTWDWDAPEGQPKGKAYTPVDWVAEVRGYDVATDDAWREWTACSLIPNDADGRAWCVHRGRLDHYGHGYADGAMVRDLVAWAEGGFAE